MMTIEELAARLEKVEAENKQLRAKARKPARPPRPARASPAVEKQEPVPPEFEGLSAETCCDACVASAAKAVQAQKRLNEIAVAYKRIPSPNRESETVMESDAEYLLRNRDIDRQEWGELNAAVLGRCVIQGGPGCAHPRKGGLSPTKRADPQAVQRFSRAARILKVEGIR